MEDNSREIIIYRADGEERFRTPINEGAKRRRELMKEDYITLPFNLATPIVFDVGDWCEVDLGEENAAVNGMYVLREVKKPAYNTETGGYEYNQQMDAWYYLWANKIFRYTPSTGGMEAIFSLTADLETHMSVLINNLRFHKFNYKGTDIVFVIDSSIAASALQVKLISYNSLNIIDALTLMCETFDCEWWITDNVIHIGRCHLGGNSYVFSLDTNTQEMTASETKTDYFTRIIAFGSTRNIPEGYYNVPDDAVKTAIVERRLRLPKSLCPKGYYDVPGTTDANAIEGVVIADEIYPHTSVKVTKVESYQSEILDEDNNGTGEFETFYLCFFDHDAFPFEADDNDPEKDYRLPGEELKMTFIPDTSQTPVGISKLNGLSFVAQWHKHGDKIGNLTIAEGEYCFEVIANEDYGLRLPNSTLKPAVGDTFSLTGWDSTKIDKLNLIPNAEDELYDYVVKFSQKSRIDPNVYSCKLFSDFAYGLSPDGELDTTFWQQYELGTPVTIRNNAFFATGERESRIIGYELCLDLPYDNPVYLVGEKTAYSRLANVESEVKEIQMNGVSYMGIGGSGGASIYVIKSNDSTAPTDSNVFSAKRAMKSFLSKTEKDTAYGQIRFNRGLTVGNFTDMSGGALTLDNEGKSYGEVDYLKVRMKAYFESLTIQEVDTVGGKVVISPAGAITLAFVDERRMLSENESNGIPEGVYRCYFLGEQVGTEVSNFWQTGDQAMSKSFNVKAGVHEGVSNHYFWRLVTGVSTAATMLERDGVKYHWIDLSKTDCDTGSDAPVGTDVVAQVGNRTDTTRQNALIFSAVDIHSPSVSLYHGIDHYSFANKEYVEYGVDKTTDKAFFNVYGDFYFGERGVDSDGNPKDPSTFIRYDSERGKMRIKADLSIGSTVGDKPIDKFVDDKVKTETEKLQETLQQQIDGVVEAFNGQGAPTLNNYPASDWTTDEERKRHNQDVYTDITPYVDDVTTPTSGQSWRWYYNSPTDYGWVKIADSDAVRALQLAQLSVRDTDVMYISHTSATISPVLPTVGADGNITSLNGWSTTAPSWSKDKYIWQTTYVRKGDGSASFSDPTCIQGARGENGRGVVSVEEYYAVSNNSSSAPALSDFTTSIPTTSVTNRYLWNYEKTTYSDNTVESTTPLVISVHGANGADGASVTKVENFFLASASASGVTTSATGWTTDASSAAATVSKTKPYLWNYEKITYSKGNPTTTAPHVVGRWSEDGVDGVGISDITEQYYLSTSRTALQGGSWSDTRQPWVAGRYYWTRSKITYTDGKVEYTSGVCVTGEAGANGTSVTARYSSDKSSWHPTPVAGDVWMQTSSDGGATWSPAYKFVGDKGDKGDTGAAGKDGQYRVPQWAKNTSATTAPTTDWSDTPVTGAAGEYVWIRWGTVIPPATAPAKWDAATRITGDKGASGQSVYMLDLSNEVSGIACNPSGTVTGTYPTSQATVYRGATQVTSGVTYSIAQKTGISTASIDASGAITMSGLTADRGEITVQAVVDGVTLTAVMTLYKVKAGAAGANGTSVTVSSTSVTYQAGTSGTTAPTGTWATSIPAVPAGQWLWTKTVVTYSDGKSTTTYSVSRQGVNGANGTNGKDGTSVTVKSTETKYYKGTSATQPADSDFTLTSIGTLTKGQWLWTRTTVTYSDNKTAKSYSAAYIGSDGSNGTPGASGYTHFAYCSGITGSLPSPTAVTGFSTTAFAGAKYIGIYADHTAADSTDFKKYEWSAYKGDKGDTGAAAVVYEIIPSVDKVTRSMTGALSASSVTCSVYKVTGNSARALSNDHTLTYQRVPDGATGTLTRTNGTSAAVSVLATTEAVIFELKNGSTLLDRERVAVFADASDMEIGGRNLLLNTVFNGSAKWTLRQGTSVDTGQIYMGHNSVKMQRSGLTANGYNGITQRAVGSFKSGDTLTLSLHSYASDISTIDQGVRMEIDCFDSANKRLAVAAHDIKPSKNGAWERKVFTRVLPANTYKVNAYIYVVRNGTMWVNSPKLEFGNVATDWSPAPEDIEERVDTFDYIKEAMKGATQINGGLVLSSMVKLGTWSAVSGDPDKASMTKVYAGMNGVYNNARTIASWWGGDMVDRFDASDNKLSPVPANAAAALIRMDGTGYLAQGNIRWKTDGSGSVANGALSWDKSGNVALGSGVIVGGNMTLSTLLGFISGINKLIVAVDKDGNELNFTNLDNAVAIKAKFDFFSTGGITALGMGSVSGGGGGGIVESIYRWGDLGKTFSDTANDTFNAYTINKIRQDLIGADSEIKNRITALEGGSATTVTTTGSGNAVTGIAKSGTVITATKGATFLTAHQSLDHINNLGNITAISGTDVFASGLRLYSVYSNGYPVIYGNLLRIGGTGKGELLAEWKGGDPATGRLYYRSKRDVTTIAWGDWQTVAYISDLAGYVTTSSASSTYVKKSGDVMSGDLTFTGIANGDFPVLSKGLVWSGSTDGASIRYKIEANDLGVLRLDMVDDANTKIAMSWKGTTKYDFLQTALNATGVTATFAAIKKNGSSDSYLLLGGGGHKALTDITSAYVTALGTSGNNLTWTKNGAANNITVPYATNSDTVDSWHGVGTSGSVLRKSGYITSSTDGLSSYWAKIGSFSMANASDRDITLWIHSAYNEKRALVHIRARGATNANNVVSMRIVVGDIPKEQLRLYYTAQNNGNCELWVNVGGRWGVFNTYVVSETGRTSAETNVITLYNTVFTAAQPFPTGMSYIEASYMTTSTISDTANKLTANAGSASLPVFFSGGKPVAVTASSMFSALASSAGTNLSVTIAGQNRTITNLYARYLANNFTSRQANMNVCYGDGTLRHFMATSSTTTGKPTAGDAHIIHLSWDNNGGFDGQIALPTTYANGMQWRTISGKDANGNYIYNSWKTLLDTSNYAATLDGRYYTESEINTKLAGQFTGLSLSNSQLSATIGGVTKTVETVLSKRNGGYASMNAVAALGNCMGMTDLRGTDATDNPNAQTNWHHFINISYNTKSNNMWQTQFAIKAGTTDVWVRSRAGGTVTNGTAWAASWVRLARTTDNVASASKLQTARNINGTGFNGTANITTAQWGTARNISISDHTGGHTGAAVSVNGGANVTLKLPDTINCGGGFYMKDYGGNSWNNGYGALNVGCVNNQSQTPLIVAYRNGGANTGTSRLFAMEMLNNGSYMNICFGGAMRYKLTNAGELTVNSLRVGSSSPLEWDSANNAFKFNGNLYATGGISALGASFTGAASIEVNTVNVKEALNMPNNKKINFGGTGMSIKMDSSGYALKIGEEDGSNNFFVNFLSDIALGEDQSYTIGVDGSASLNAVTCGSVSCSRVSLSGATFTRSGNEIYVQIGSTRYKLTKTTA